MRLKMLWQSLKVNHIDHSDLTFELPQYEAQQDIIGMCDVIIDNDSKFRNVFPAEFIDIIKAQQNEDWIK